MSHMYLAVIQMKTTEDKLTNLKTAANFINKACEQKVDMVILPEMFNCPYNSSNFPTYAEPENGDTYNYLSDLAREHKVYIVGGSIPEKDFNGNIYNTSYVFDRKGKQIAKHRKVHLFDIQIEGGQYFKESDTLNAGNNVTTFNTEFATFGLAICYDFRFPELSRMMVNNGAKAIIIPASFNLTTGPAHWEILFKSRAIDNQVYTIGCSSSRDCSASYISYGNSIAVSPWGEIINRMDEKEGYFICKLDFSYVDKIRNELPLLSHRRLDLYNQNT